MIIGFEYFEEIFFVPNWSLFLRYRVVNMNFGSNFGAWVSFPTAVLHSPENFKEIWAGQW